jgi:hypothetical protein
MTTTSTNPLPTAQRQPPPKWLYRIVNGVMILLLRSPLHGLLSKVIMLITFTGRKSGKQFTTPISYLRDGKVITCFTGSPWWKNLQGGAPVILRIEGQTLNGIAQTNRDPTAVAQATQEYLQRNGGVKSARNLALSFDPNREPTFEEIKAAVQGRTLIQITVA